MFNKEKSVCVLYTTATCNLNCRYCYIDKSPALIKIDKILEESFSGDYYINFMKEIFDKIDNLEQIQFWGGEPSYGLHRAIPTVKKAIEYYPNLHIFMMSTNLATPTVVDDLLEFWRIFKDYPDRKFAFDLQLSLDGPKAINDYNRGKGTTEKFTTNFSKMVFQINDLYKEIPNLQIRAHFKPTLDTGVLQQLLTKEDIIKYYKCFEFYKEIFETYNHNENAWLNCPVPNFATPSIATTQDGKNFGYMCKLCNEIMQDPNNTPFKYYNSIIPFIDDNHTPNLTCRLDQGCSNCGTGYIVIGLLPNHMLSACHQGFTDLLSEYKEYAQKKVLEDKNNSEIDSRMFSFDNTVKNQLIFNLQDWKTYTREADRYLNSNAHFQTTELSSLIRTMAIAKQINTRYVDPKNAIYAAKFMFSFLPTCIRDNIAVSGSKFLFQVGYIRLLLNGAEEEIMKWWERHDRKNI